MFNELLHAISSTPQEHLPIDIYNSHSIYGGTKLLDNSLLTVSR